MDYLGLLSKYKVNRPLSNDEIKYRLYQDKKLLAQPLHQLSVIRINSTFLECTDKFFPWKGFISFLMIWFISMVIWFIGTLSIWVFSKGLSTIYFDRKTEILSVLCGLTVCAIAMIFVFILFLRKESFAFTHYPILFNRKTQTVSVFRTNGTVLEVPWKDVFFTLSKTRMRGGCEILGHVLDSERITIKDTFALSYYGGISAEELEITGIDILETDYIRRHWEFIRRYMEEGPAKLIDKVDHVMRIATQRETFWNGFHRLVAEFGQFPVIAIAMMPLLFFIAVGRWFAVQTSRIPQWPTAIEERCAIEPNDPYMKG